MLKNEINYGPVYLLFSSDLLRGRAVMQTPMQLHGCASLHLIDLDIVSDGVSRETCNSAGAVRGRNSSKANFLVELDSEETLNAACTMW